MLSPVLSASRQAPSLLRAILPSGGSQPAPAPAWDDGSAVKNDDCNGVFLDHGPLTAQAEHKSGRQGGAADWHKARRTGPSAACPAPLRARLPSHGRDGAPQRVPLGLGIVPTDGPRGRGSRIWQSAERSS